MSQLQRIRDDLREALSRRDPIELSTLRSLLSALDNATAVEGAENADPKVGLGHDVPRRDLGDGDIRRIIESERSELDDAARRYRELGLESEAAEMETRAGIVERYLSHGT